MVGKSRICEICGVREKRRGGFFANFPLDQSRCKKWVKIVGKEDLVHIPIEKLNQVRHICGDHFVQKDFIRKGSRLKKTAIPSVHLHEPPLTEDQMRDFPLHVASYKGVAIHCFPHPRKPDQIDRFRTWVMKILGDIVSENDLFIYKNRRVCHRHFEARYTFPNNRLTSLAIPTLHLPGIIVTPARQLPMQIYQQSAHPSTTPQVTTAADIQTQTHEAVASTSHASISSSVPMKHDSGTTITKEHNYCFSDVYRMRSSSDKGKQSTSNDATNSKVIEQENVQNTKNDVNKATSDVIGEKYMLNETDSWIPGADYTIESLEDTEPETIPEGPYTWQKTPLVCTDDVEEVSNDESPAKEPLLTTVTRDVEPEFTEYVCNECNCNISGARYTCVQCSDYDMCADCEARGVHALHYALRVPEHSLQDDVLRVIEAIRKCLNENPSKNMNPEDEGIKEEIKDEDKESDVEECDPLRREEQLDPQAREQQDSTDIHIVPASYAEAVSVKTANTILVHTTNSTPMPVGHAITIPVGHSNSAPVKLIGLQEVGSRDIGSPKNISLRKNIVLKSNLLLPPINKTTITSQNVNTMSLSNLRGNTVVLAKRDAVGNLIVSEVIGKSHLVENHRVIDLEDPNTKKPRYSKGKDEQTSQPARLNIKKRP